MNEALNVALNNLGAVCYLVDVGSTPNSSNELLGVTKVSNPGGLNWGEIKYTPLKSGVVKKVDTTLEYDNIEIDVAHEDEKTITLLNKLARATKDRHREFVYVPTERDEANDKRAFKALVTVAGMKPNDATADSFQATTYTLRVSSMEDFKDTISN